MIKNGARWIIQVLESMGCNQRLKIYPYREEKLLERYDHIKSQGTEKFLNKELFSISYKNVTKGK